MTDRSTSLDHVLLVIPTLNEQACIAQCLHSLTHTAPPMDIVVVDGGSHDRTRDIVRDLQKDHPRLHLLKNPARLQSAGINLTVSHYARAHHRVLLRCDAHATYPPHFAARLATALAQHQAASVVVPMDSTGRTGFARAAAWAADMVLGSGGAAHRGGTRSGWVAHGHHAAFDLGWFQRIGGYDPTFSHNEDAEYDARLTAAGGRIWLDSDIRLAYLMRPNLQALTKQYLAYGQGRARTLTKHRLRPKLRQSLPVIHLLLSLLCLCSAPFAPWALLYPASYLALLMTCALICTMRLRRLSGLWAGPALLAMHMGWAAGFLWQMHRSWSSRLWRGFPPDPHDRLPFRPGNDISAQTGPETPIQGRLE